MFEGPTYRTTVGWTTVLPEDREKTCVTDIEKLLAIEELKVLKARYMRCVDEKDWQSLRALFCDDATFHFSNGPGEVDGPDAFVAAAATALQHANTVHHGHCPEIELTGPDSARGIWAMEDRLVWPATDGEPERRMHGMGHYRETYRKVGGDWKIATWSVTRLRVDTEGF